MKKILSLILSLAIVLSFGACYDKKDTKNKGIITSESNADKDKTDNKDNPVLSDGVVMSDGEALSDGTLPENIGNVDEGKVEPPSDDTAKVPEANNNKVPSEDAPAGNPAPAPNGGAPANNNTSNNNTLPDNNKPTTYPAAGSNSVGNVLLGDFNSKANSYSDAASLAQALVSNPVIAFKPATESVSPGILTGFGNAQITGFTSGAKFCPMIGTIPFVGYVFIVEDASKASSLISTLKSNANPNWNVCSTADETITGSVGNKVFFLMCPEKFE